MLEAKRVQTHSVQDIKLTSVDIAFHSQQFQLLFKNPLVCTNNTSSALETVSDYYYYY